MRKTSWRRSSRKNWQNQMRYGKQTPLRLRHDPASPKTKAATSRWTRKCSFYSALNDLLFLKQQSVSEACSFLRLKSGVHNVCMPFSILCSFLLNEVKPQSIFVALFLELAANSKFDIFNRGCLWKTGILHSGESQHIFANSPDYIFILFAYYFV